MLDKAGAEKLLGSGDMLFLTTEMSGQPRRIQGAWVSDEEEEKVADFLKSQRPPEYNNDVISQPVQIFGPKMRLANNYMLMISNGLSQQFKMHV
jgi:S-DNA-T family DNA segregation ATPase FtsK/SpoIIIE